ncbi:MAG: carboxymuconolactone decarboxylase family protein [Candidatus Glassbacteria bacterium]
MSEIPSRQYHKVKDEHGDFMESVEALGQATKKAGPIDEKTAHLIQLAAAAAIRSEGAVHSHTRRAHESGASRAEIHHALILLASTIGFPTVTAALSWADDVLEKS